MAELPIIRFRAGKNFDTDVVIEGPEAFDVIYGLQLKPGAQAVLQDEYDIEYIASITKIEDEKVFVHLQELLKDRLIVTDHAGVRGRMAENRRKKGGASS